jgi:hypothetical protein
MNTRNRNPNVEREATQRTRRAFLTMGAAGAAGYGGWTWLRSRSQAGGVEWPLRGALRGNQRIAEAWFSDGHLSPTFDRSRVDGNTRKNGDVGLGEDFETRDGL